MRARRQAPRRGERRTRASGGSARRGTILLVLCCYALSTACLALGYALGDWRLVAGGVAGLGVERARPGARPAALLVHAGLAVALAARISRPDARHVAVESTSLPPPPPRPKPSTRVIGSALGLDDDSTVGLAGGPR